MRRFVFSHGGRHGAWAWQFVIERLETLGHVAVAIDLPVEEPDAGAVRCAEVIAAAARRLGGPVTVVAHSVSGLIIPLVPDLAEVEELAFVCCPLPRPGLSLWEQMTTEPDTDLFVRENLDRMRDAHAEGDPVGIARAQAIHTYYHDLPDELAAWAVDQLRPPMPLLTEEKTPFTRWPDVRLRYVLGQNDRIVNPVWSRREVPRRLGIMPDELPTGHSPFLALPDELVEVLLAPIEKRR